jgi:hypothetical protein
MEVRPDDRDRDGQEHQNIALGADPIPECQSPPNLNRLPGACGSLSKFNMS